VHVVAPIIQRGIRQLQPSNGPRVLVYLTKANPELITVLQSMRETFVVYGQNRVGEDRNIIYRAQGPGFLADLAACKAIIGTTGFSLIADSIYLKKPYFGIPLRRQFEQEHNARFLVQSGLGDSSDSPSPDKLERFLSRLPEYRQKLAEYDLDPTDQEETLRRLLGRLAPPPTPNQPDGLTALSREA
jgi:uncharacterized protein (TIGR00661 family)